MAAITRAMLVDAARDLNRGIVGGLSPNIDVTQGVEKLKELIKEAGTILDDADDVSDETRAVVAALSGAGEAEEAAEEAEAEAEAGEVKTAPKPKGKTAKAKEKTAAVTAKETPKAKKETAAPKAKAPAAGKPGGRLYEGSQAERMDTAAMKGGSLEAIAEASGLPLARVKFHIRHRETISNAKWKVTRKGDHVKLEKREAATA